MQFAHRREFAAVREALLERIGAGESDILEHQWLDIGFTTLWLFDAPVNKRGRTLVDVFLERRGARLSSGERRYLQRMRASRMRLYEVRDVKYDEGMLLRDLIDGKEIWVEERLGTHDAVVHLTLCVRLMEGPRGVTQMDGAVVTIEPTHAQHLVKTLARLSDHDAGVLILRELLERAKAPLPELTTTEGDRVEVCQAIFDVLNPQELLKALERSDAFDKVDDGLFVWLDKAGTLLSVPQSRRELGVLHLAGSRLTAEVMSQSRAQRIRELLEKISPDSVRFRLTSVQSLESAMKEHRQSGIDSAPSDPELSSLERQWKEQYYRDWLDIPVPALGNRTPRYAARLKTVRPKLIALIKEMQLHEDRASRDSASRYDFSWMFDELGLTL